MRSLTKSATLVAACVAVSLAATTPASSRPAALPSGVPQPQSTPIWCGGVTWPVDVGVCIPPWDLVVGGRRVR